MSAPARGLVIAAPQSGSGKTVFTLGLVRALARTGRAVASAKSGPDYIDPRFHEAASGTPCINLDAWAMAPESIRRRARAHAPADGALIIEGTMGLFDGAETGGGSTADLAAVLGLPVMLVVDAARQAQSVAALVEGFARYRDDIVIAGVVLNRVASPRHERMLRGALARCGISVVGALTSDAALVVPSRHLGLVQAEENADLARFIDLAADKIARECDLEAILAACGPLAKTGGPGRALPPPGQRLAVARDRAFAFVYPHLLEDWRAADCAITFFSPLADEAPDPACDAVYLPGGYPELWAGTIAGAARCLTGIRAAAARGATVYGECGGYMVLGEALTDGDGRTHPMLGLLPLETSFAEPRRQLGYRVLTPLGGTPWSGRLMAHEFHYCATISEGDAGRPFAAEDAAGNDLGTIGLRRGTVFGSFAHIIDRG